MSWTIVLTWTYPSWRRSITRHRYITSNRYPSQLSASLHHTLLDISHNFQIYDWNLSVLNTGLTGFRFLDCKNVAEKRVAKSRISLTSLTASIEVVKIVFLTGIFELFWIPYRSNLSDNIIALELFTGPMMLLGKLHIAFHKELLPFKTLTNVLFFSRALTQNT